MEAGVWGVTGRYTSIGPTESWMLVILWSNSTECTRNTFCKASAPEGVHGHASPGNFYILNFYILQFASSSIPSLRITFRKPRDSAFNSFLRPKGGELVWCHKDRCLWRCDIFFCFARAATAECSIVYNHTSPKQNEQQGRTGKQPTTTRNCRSRFLHKRCIDSYPQSVLALL